MEAFILACLAELPKYAGITAAALFFVYAMAVVDALTASVYAEQRKAIRDAIRDRFRWYLRPKSKGEMPPHWKPMDTSHLSRALRERRGDTP